jgi:hypothetical protein
MHFLISYLPKVFHWYAFPRFYLNPFAFQQCPLLGSTLAGKTDFTAAANNSPPRQIMLSATGIEDSYHQPGSMGNSGQSGNLAIASYFTKGYGLDYVDDFFAATHYYFINSNFFAVLDEPFSSTQ